MTHAARIIAVTALNTLTVASARTLSRRIKRFGCGTS